MAATGYLWRQLNQKQREELLEWRKSRAYPWHSPPHRPNFGHLRFLISAACYKHRHHIGHSPPRIDNFVGDLLAVLEAHANQTFAWCVLPNHYHGAASRPHFTRLEHRRTHPRTKGFFRAVERAMRSDRHYWATLNYVHHNPVRHGYVERWTDWRWRSAAEYLARTGASEAKRAWREYPIHQYGKNWDDPEM
jgi:putative transposase